MKPKVYVLIALLLSVIVAGLILILGLVSRKLLPLYLIIFLLIIFIYGIFLIKKTLTDKVFIIGIILLVMLAISLTLFLTNLKTYYDVTSNYGNLENTDFKQMQSETEYYLAYAEYLKQELNNYQSQSRIMELNLANLKQIELEKLQQQNSVNNIPIIEPVPVDVPVLPTEDNIQYRYTNDDIGE